MSTRSLRGLFALVLLLLVHTDRAQAHPHLYGSWVANVPPGGFMALDFGPAEYMGVGVWRGPFTFTVTGQTSCGVYELRMYTGTQGTVSLRDGNMIGTKVGTVDFETRKLTYLQTTFVNR